jgi:Pyridoxamine 5'-phosphate oxidase
VSRRDTDADAFVLTGEETAFLHEHQWGVLATTRRDGSPQQSMVGYVVDDHGRIVVSVKSHTAKWKNARRHPQSASPSSTVESTSPSPGGPR